MADLINRLRALSRHEHSDMTIGDEAADAIEALQSEVVWRRVFCREWLDKTEWVQQTLKPRELGHHRADIVRQRIEHAEARAERLVEALRIAEAALADIGDADREPGDDVAWCERRASLGLRRVRDTLRGHNQENDNG